MTGSTDIEHNGFVSQISTTMRASTSTCKDGDFLSHFDKVYEAQAQIQVISPKHLLIKNHVAANRSKMKGQLPLDQIFGFCRTYKEILNY